MVERLPKPGKKPFHRDIPGVKPLYELQEKIHGKIFISFDKSKKHLLPGIKQPFDLPPKLFINFIEEIKKQIIKGNDLIPNKAAITFEKIRAFSGYYRHWFSTTKYNVQPNLYYPELSFFTLTKIKKSLNPFNTDVPNELRNCPLIKDFEKINNIKYCDKKTYEFYRDKRIIEKSKEIGIQLASLED